MPPATTTAMQMAAGSRGGQAKVHPEGSSEARYVEEDDSSLETKAAIRETVTAGLGDEDRPVFVTDTCVIDPRCPPSTLIT
jgi:hypothetical protein